MSRRRALGVAAAVTAVALAGCLVATVALLRSGGGGETVRVASAESSAVSVESSSSSSSAAAATATSILPRSSPTTVAPAPVAPPGGPSTIVPRSIVVQGTLPSLDTPARAWRLPAGADVDTARVDALEKVLGGALGVGHDAKLPWSFASSAPQRADRAAPSPDGARRVAEDLWRAGGYDVAALDVTVSGDDSVRFVSGAARIDGVPSPLALAVTVGSGGRILNASGFFGRPEPGDEYPRIGTAAAIAQLQRGAPTTDRRTAPPPTLADPPVVPPLPSVLTIPWPGHCTQAESGCEPPAPLEPIVVDPIPPQPAPPVTITGVEESLALLPAAGGPMWLVPAYTFTSTDGGRYEALAVDTSPLSG